MKAKPKPEQDLSLLPGIYYHPEAELEEELYPNGTPEWRVHYMHGEVHGVWEVYRPDGTLWWRTHYHHGKRHGVREGYNSKNGKLTVLEFWYKNEKQPFFIETLLNTPILEL
jgi:antitoxin component YwqK of YwqJK toxin-antitoxin module